MSRILKFKNPKIHEIINPVDGSKINIKYDKRYNKLTISKATLKKIISNTPINYVFNPKTVKYEKKKKLITKYEKLQELLRNNRDINNYSIIQNCPINITYDIPIFIDKNFNSFKLIVSNEYIKLFNIWIYALIQDAIYAINKNKTNIKEYAGSVIQLLYVVEANGATPRYTEIRQLDNAYNLNFKIQTQESKPYVILGYKITMIKSNNIFVDNVITDLKAFHPCNNLKFHQLSVASTSGSGLCIYETFRHIFNIKSLKYSRRENVDYREELYESLKNEGEDIEKSVKKGELVKSVCLLTKKYNKDVIIHFFGSHLTHDNVNKVYKIDGRKPIYINNGEVCDFTIDIINNHIDKMAFLYEIDKHVAPFRFVSMDISKSNKIKEKKNNGFVLKPHVVKKNIKPMGIIGFDAETFNDDDKMANAFNITVYGKCDNKQIEKSFYGISCVDEFVNYINEICIKMNNQKTRPTESIPPIYIYGFNNSKFDNLLIYKQLYNIDPNTEYVFTGNSIKYIKFNNVYIYDMHNFYTGSLADCAKAFKLSISKGIYPYKFPNANNLNYIGEVPPSNYWNNYNDYSEALKSWTIFDLKDITEKYCMLDSKLVYEIAIKHIENCSGIINNHQYDVRKCPTAANLALKMFTQCFLNEDIRQSPDDIIKCEKDAYFGGKTEVYKKRYIKRNGTYLSYYDINSSYPASMTKTMPYKFIKKVDLDNDNITINEITDHYLYNAKSEYLSNNKNYIPNLFVRNTDNSLMTYKNKPYGYHWGCELKEAINAGCKVSIKEIIMYEGKVIFKDFAEYFYNERRSIKISNPAKALFYKTVMNSLYGKFGQKSFTHSKICNNDDIARHINNDVTKLIDIKEIDNKICLIEYKGENDEYNNIGQLVRFSSYISALSRTNLCRVMRDVGYENVYYCDTDSIFTTKEPSSEFLDNNILGKWKKENENDIIDAEFLAPKTYIYKCANDEVVIKTKGANFKVETKNDKEVNELYNNIKDVNNGNKSDIKCELLMFNRSLAGIKIDNMERTIKTVHNKRIFNEEDSEAY
jgi:hypothetical protein